MVEPLRRYEPSGAEIRPVEQVGPRPVEPVERMATPELSLRGTPIHHAYRVLKFAFTVAPIIAGVDKYFHYLVNWDQYLSPLVPSTLNYNAHNFMLIAGAVEIIVGIGVALKPKVFAYIVSAWLMVIVVNLLTTGQYFDIALRDFGLSLAAFALGRLSHFFDLGRRARRSMETPTVTTRP